MEKNAYQILFRYEVLDENKWTERAVLYFEFAKNSVEAFEKMWERVGGGCDIELFSGEVKQKTLDGKYYYFMITNLSDSFPTVDYFYIANSAVPIDINPNLNIRPARLIHEE